MLEIVCSGTSYQIGQQHGTQAKKQVLGSLAFYRDLFQKTCSMSWEEVRAEATKYLESLRDLTPRYLEEIQGIADAVGQDVDLIDILALNVRTEITFGLFTEKPHRPPVPVDGCTSVGYRSPDGRVFLAQNWDWQVEQAANLVLCHIKQRESQDLPDIRMVTEGGVIGKIGFNDCGVGVLLNAIRARGVDVRRLPIHLALRTALDASGKAEAIARLWDVGLAGSGHILIADAEGGPTGLECTSRSIKHLEMDANGLVVHANNLLLLHPEVDEPPWLLDSPVRVQRMDKLVRERIISTGRTGFDAFFDLFKDEDGYPFSINRCQESGCATQTLFNIVMDLTARHATVTFGRPTDFTSRLHRDLDIVEKMI